MRTEQKSTLSKWRAQFLQLRLLSTENRKPCTSKMVSQTQMRYHQAYNTHKFALWISFCLVLLGTARGSDLSPSSGSVNNPTGWFGRFSVGGAKKLEQPFDADASVSTILAPPPPPPPPSILNETSPSQHHFSEFPSPSSITQHLPTWGYARSTLPSYPPWDMPPNTYPEWTNPLSQQTVHTLETQLHQALEYQSLLYSEIQNLTSNIMELHRNDDLRKDLIHRLTQQLSDAQVNARDESNRATEYQNRCDLLQNTITNLTCSLELSQQACINVTQDLEKQKQQVSSILLQIRQKDVQLEEFATGIEKARIQRQLEEKRRIREESKTKRKGGIFTWIYHWFSPTYLDSSLDEDDDLNLEDLARSTLLHALQNERNIVQELETTISTLQQNNSAIADMVLSRDSLIEELNSRVGVFEDDKMVLKAALRQLQNEIKQEAPITEQLIESLDKARQDVRSLESELETLKSLHQKEQENMAAKLIEKQTIIDETDSKMHQIGIYVDQLEERLALFAMARRDIENREECCKILENNMTRNLDEMGRLQSQLQVILHERDEVKKLVDLLVQERTALEKKKFKLEEELKTHITEGENTRNLIFTLNGELSEMKQHVSVLTSRIGEMESDRGQMVDQHQALSLDRNDLQQKLTNFESEIQILLDEKEKNRQRITEVETSKRELEDQLTNSLHEVKLCKAEIERLNRSRVVFDDPLSPLELLWDHIGDVGWESHVESDPRIYFNQLNVSFVQSWSENVSHAILLLPHHDSSDLVLSMCVSKLCKVLTNQTVISSITKLLIDHESNFLNDMTLAHLDELALIFLTKFIVKSILCGPPQKPIDINTLSEQKSYIPPPPPALPVLDIFDDDGKIYVDDTNSTLHGRVAQSKMLKVQNDVLRENGFDSDVDTDTINLHFNIQSVEKEVFRAEQQNIVDNIAEWDGDVEDLENQRSDDTSSSLRRKVPFRRIRKFFSKATGMHGLITAPSTRRMDNVQNI